MKRTALAHKLFENMISNCSDEDLNEAVESLLDYQDRFGKSFNSLKSVPFSRDLIDLLLDQHSYRNQVDSE